MDPHGNPVESHHGFPPVGFPGLNGRLAAVRCWGRCDRRCTATISEPAEAIGGLKAVVGV